MNVIEIDKLTKSYGKARGIIDVSFNVKEGEIFGFIGPNGAGKSTTIRTLLALIYPSSGAATIFGKDIVKDSPEIKKDIGYLPSEIFYYDKIKVNALLKYSASFFKQDCSQRINELAEIMELDLNRRIEDLSYGNRKKVGIVQGLLHEPKLLLLDEPTSGLDPLMQQKFFDLIEEENKKGVTVLFSSHILSEVQQLCNRVAIIKEGSIIKIQNIKELQNDHYKKITVKGTGVTENMFQLNGVTNLEKNSDELSFFYKGDINIILKTVNSRKIDDIIILNPSLEEIFMHYYE